MSSVIMNPTCNLIKEKNTNLSLKYINAKTPLTFFVVNIFYMGILCITLKDRNIKRFVQNWHSPKSPSDSTE